MSRGDNATGADVDQRLCLLDIKVNDRRRRATTTALLQAIVTNVKGRQLTVYCICSSTSAWQETIGDNGFEVLLIRVVTHTQLVQASSEKNHVDKTTTKHA